MKPNLILLAALVVVLNCYVLAADPFAPPAAPAAPATAAVQRAQILVGIDEGDFRGADNRVLQAAVDQVAGLGGGTVRIGPGRYLMRNALILRDNVSIIGAGGRTILAACDGVVSPLAADGDCNERQITLEDASGFAVGDGVSIQDKAAGGFMVTTATLTARIDANTFRISAPLYLDYMVAKDACARLVFPVVGGWNVKNVVVEGLAIDGNRGKSQPLNGCRGAGIYLFECDEVTIRNCDVRQYNGDGISFQVSQRVTVEGCTARDNAGIGIHPGSGSQHPIVRKNRATGNGTDGLYVCWRVKHGLFEENQFVENSQSGISIGHKDSDNLFRNNVSTGNGAWGILFRQEEPAMGAHRNVFVSNRILDNNTALKPGQAAAAIFIRGHHHDLVFRDNTIGRSQPASAGAPAGAGIVTGVHAKGLKSENNRFTNVAMEVAAEPPGK